MSVLSPRELASMNARTAEALIAGNEPSADDAEMAGTLALVSIAQSLVVITEELHNIAYIEDEKLRRGQ